MNTCANNPSCEFLREEVINGVNYLVYKCLDTDTIEKYPEEAPLAPAPNDNSPGDDTD